MGPILDADAEEQLRLAELDSYQILDTEPEAAYDAIVHAATLVAGVPMAGIGLITATHDWFKAITGVALEAVPRDLAFCDRVVRSGRALVVEDTGLDARFADHPMVTAGLVGFYAGFPLRTPTGRVMGSLCVMDSTPHQLSDNQRTILSTLADQVMAQLELRRQASEAYAARDAAKRHSTILDAVLDSLDVGVLVCDTEGRLMEDNACNRDLLGVSVDALRDVGEAGRADLAPMSDLQGVPLPLRDRPIARTLREGDAGDTEVNLLPPNRPPRIVRVRGRTMHSPTGEVFGVVTTMQDVTEARHREQDLAARMRDVEQLAAASRLILSGEDVNAAACAAVKDLCQAQQVTVVVPDGAGRLVVSATTEASLVDFVIPLEAPGNLPHVFRTRQRVVVGEPGFEVEMNPAAQALIVDRHGPIGGVVYLPLVRGADCLGVLLVSTTAEFNQTSMRVMGLLEILAAELSTALDRNRLRRELATQAGTDPLTGLANRRTWDERIAARLTPDQGASSSCLAILDLDYFKAYNDSRGHQAGDELLRDAAAAWTRNTRSGDLFARLGGEEFGILLTGCSLPDAIVVVRSLLDLVPGGQTASAGVAERRPAEDATSWYARADLALYRAKSDGRNRVCADDGPCDDRRDHADPRDEPPAVLTSFAAAQVSH